MEAGFAARAARPPPPPLPSAPVRDGLVSSLSVHLFAASDNGAAVAPVGSGAEVAHAKRMLHVVTAGLPSDPRKCRINCEDVCSVRCWPASCRGKDGEKRLLAFTKRSTNIHSDVFGSETKGSPQSALDDCCRDCLGGGTIRIPMVETYVRCLNLRVSVGIALYEAGRQLNYEQLQYQPELPEEAQGLFPTEDIYS